ncbi:MAG: NAD(P)-dependent oxidoreductase [Acidimicrobiales bacterium]
MDVLVSDVAFDRFRDRLHAVEGVGWLVMDGAGEIRAGGLGPSVAWEHAAPEVAFGTYDLFHTGASRRFLGFVKRCESIRWFQSPAAGFENPFFAEVVRRGIRLTTGHGTAVAISEYILRSVLDAFQEAQRWRDAAAKHEWTRPAHRFREVAGSTWLIVGVGAIGSETARRAQAFGAHVIGVRRHPSGAEPVDRMIGPAQLAAVVGEADVLVLAAPATAATAHLVDADLLARMRPGSVLVNVARGALVDEAALLAALDAGAPGAAVLDVTEEEPLAPDSPLWMHPAVTITPHAAGRSVATNDRLLPTFLENLRRYRAGEPLLNERTPADLEEPA